MVLLKQKREEKGISQYRLSVLSGVPQQTISGIESEARKNPGIGTLYALCAALGCSLSDIYIPDEEKERIDHDTTGIDGAAG